MYKSLQNATSITRWEVLLLERVLAPYVSVLCLLVLSLLLLLSLFSHVAPVIIH
jgi:hypothetical protein